MATYFTSDAHFGDHRVLNLYPRPFPTVAEMDAELIRRWNTVVTADDEVWHLGDFARTARRANEVLAQLSGRKHLVTGNNDPDDVGGGWARVAPYAEIEREGRFLVLCHYPFRSWNRQHKGALNLHGHSHGRMKELARQFDVGVDVWDYRPVSLATLLASRKG
ncbi:metallophosphoesterase family protein [Phenylobacterium sp.]|uniref:metallophosphoesterase family protein n=1 Tax=Phenylobacterium sp. TaxID=1871053 RepID=UPI002C42AEA9|nr:metallophosphoesterase family protein [Phenylobacterium sp.]HVI33803.1 metallophosphoesterase family protein [Phenylobacterium sp.]